MSFLVHQHESAELFLRRAEGWLLQNEAENNLVLDCAYGRIGRPLGPGGYLATIEDDARVVGCAYRNQKFGLSRMPLEAVPALVANVRRVHPQLREVFGPESEAAAFAAQWAQDTSIRPRRGLPQIIYQTNMVDAPAPTPNGWLRSVQPKEFDLVTTWVQALSADADFDAIRARRFVLEQVAAESLFLWEDDQPKCLVGVCGRTRSGAQIGSVYTPPALRRRGYASASVAELTRRLLASGLSHCFLYTVAANLVTNSIYRRIGYRPVCQVVDYVLDGSTKRPLRAHV